MILQVYSVFDSKVEAFMQPFFMASRGSAIRAFSDNVNDKSSMLSKHPGDFTLFEIAKWDDSNAKFEILPTPVSCGLAIEFISDKS